MTLNEFILAQPPERIINPEACTHKDPVGDILGQYIRHIRPDVRFFRTGWTSIGIYPDERMLKPLETVWVESSTRRFAWCKTYGQVQSVLKTPYTEELL